MTSLEVLEYVLVSMILLLTIVFIDNVVQIAVLYVLYVSVACVWNHEIATSMHCTGCCSGEGDNE